MIAESKEHYDNQLKIQKLRDTISAVNDLLAKAKKNGAKSLHCMVMRLVEERIAHPERYKEEERNPEFEDLTPYDYAIASDNVLAVLLVVNSVLKNAQEPWQHVLHIVTYGIVVAAMQAWFKMRPAQGGVRVEVKVTEDFKFLNASYAPVPRQLKFAKI